MLKFSFLVPTYNQKDEFLIECLDSLLGQDYPDFDVVLCRQGGEDLGWVAERYPSARMIDLEKPSSYKSRIALYEEAKGGCDYVWFVDSDDKLLTEHALSDVARILEAKGRPDILCHSCHPMPEPNDLISLILSSDEFNAVHQRIFSAKLKPIFPDLDLFLAEDKLMNLCFAREAEKVAYTHNEYYWYRPNLASGSKNFKITHFADLSKVSLWIERDFHDRPERFLSYQRALYHFLSNFVKADSLGILNKELFREAMSSDAVPAFLDLCRQNKRDVLCKSGFKRRLAYIAILDKSYSRLKMILRFYKLSSRK